MWFDCQNFFVENRYKFRIFTVELLVILTRDCSHNYSIVNSNIFESINNNYTQPLKNGWYNVSENISFSIRFGVTVFFGSTTDRVVDKIKNRLQMRNLRMFDCVFVKRWEYFNKMFSKWRCFKFLHTYTCCFVGYVSGSNNWNFSRRIQRWK